MIKKISATVKNRKGFTLLELVLSLAVFSVVFAASFSVLFSGMKVYRNNSASVEEQISLRMVLMRIDNDIRSFGGELNEITASGNSISIGALASYAFDEGTESITRTSGGESAVVAESIAAFSSAMEPGGILVQITGKNDGRTIFSRIKLRNPVDS